MPTDHDPGLKVLDQLAALGHGLFVTAVRRLLPLRLGAASRTEHHVGALGEARRERGTRRRARGVQRTLLPDEKRRGTDRRILCSPFALGDPAPFLLHGGLQSEAFVAVVGESYRGKEGKGKGKNNDEIHFVLCCVVAEGGLIIVSCLLIYVYRLPTLVLGTSALFTKKHSHAIRRKIFFMSQNF